MMLWDADDETEAGVAETFSDRLDRDAEVMHSARCLGMELLVAGVALLLAFVWAVAR